MRRFRSRWIGIALLFGLAGIAFPRRALAHEKWFTPAEFHAPDWSLVLSERTALALGVGVVVVAAFGVAQRLIGDPDWPRLPFFARMARGDMTLLAVQTAIALIYMAVRLSLLAHNLQLPASPLGFAVAAVELAIAFSFITGLLDRLGAILLLAMGLAVLVLFGPLNLLAQVHYAGIALAILLVSRSGETAQPRPPFDSPEWGATGIVALRILTGVAFLTLALADKVWNPTLGEAFLERYPHFNVLQLAGWGVSDALFVLLAGVVETAIGLLLVSGFLTRVVILVLLVPFNITVPFLPAEEMIGHLPIFGIFYLLLVHGSGTALQARQARSPRT
jgi:uncharacterized membrane protein YphA (DoxX/SURF4 family)